MTISSLLRLYQTARQGRSRDSTQQLAALIALAESAPQDSGAQAVAAYNAWLEGEHDVAMRFAKRADDLGSIPFPVLLVLTALHAPGNDETATYGYAKRLAIAERHDKTAHSVARVLAGSGFVTSGSRAAEREHVDAVSKVFDEWVQWSQEFTRSYESRNDD